MKNSVSKAIKSEPKEQKGGFLMMLLHDLITLDASLLGNLLKCKGMKTKMPSKGVMRACEEIITASEGLIKAGQDF